MSARAAGRPAAAVWVRLARCYDLALGRLRREAGGGVTLAQFDVLAQLARHPDGMTPGALSRALLVTAGNVTGIVARLAALGLVRRAPDPDDARLAILTLTARGRQVAAAEVVRHERRLERLLAPLAPPERARLCAALDRLRAVLERDRED